MLAKDVRPAVSLDSNNERKARIRGRYVASWLLDARIDATQSGGNKLTLLSRRRARTWMTAVGAMLGVDGRNTSCSNRR